jgi:anti-sigma regulatory factor (Ser/Thr protein kinase)
MQGQYRHQALPYHGHDEFLSCCVALADAAREDDERVLFLVAAGKLDGLRDRLGVGADVRYVATDEHARNPALLTTLLDDFRAADDRRCVGVNEPAVPGRSPAAQQEARFGESVLNSHRLDSWDMSVVCLYDVVDVDADALECMRQTHPEVRGAPTNPDYRPGLAARWFASPLDDPREPGREVGRADLAATRGLVREHAERGGLDADRREDFVLAANEIVTNSLLHGGGSCRLTLWADDHSVLCEVRDAGHITDPLVGRLAPSPGVPSGRGLWLANHLCDLVQIRSSPAGTTVRLRVDR